MFSRGIRICTGTGIGAALSTCIQNPNWLVRAHYRDTRKRLTSLCRFLVWIGSDQEKTFGPTITGLIKKHIEPERRILWDSKRRGRRPDTVGLLKRIWASWNAEGNTVRLSLLLLWAERCPIVIFITSNYQGNAEMMEGCREGAHKSPSARKGRLPALPVAAGLHAFGTLWDF